MKIRKGTFPIEKKLFDAEGAEAGSVPDEGYLLIFEMTMKEFNTVFGKDIDTVLAGKPQEILATLAAKWVGGKVSDPGGEE